MDDLATSFKSYYSMSVDLPDDVTSAESYPPLVSDSKRIFSRNPSRDYFPDWIPLNFSLVDHSSSFSNFHC